MATTSQEWVIVRFQYNPLNLWLNYEDSRGNKRTAPVDPMEVKPDWFFQVVPDVPPDIFIHVFVPPDFHKMVHDLLDALPLDQPPPHGNGPVPLAIFIDSPSRTDATRWEKIVKHLLPPPLEDRIQFVRMPQGSRTRRGSRTPFSLPLRLLAVGKRFSGLIDQIRSFNWYQYSSEVQKFGIDLQLSTSSTYSLLKHKQWDIVLTDLYSVADVMKHIERLPGTAKPRLTVFVGPTDSEPYVNSLNIQDTALLFVPEWHGPDLNAVSLEFLKDFLFGIVHDYPLHEAVKSAARARIPPLPQPPVLIADTASNNSLRISDAVPQLVTRAESVRQWFSLGDISQFITRASVDIGEPLRTKLRDLDSSRSRLHDAMREVRATPSRVRFEQETAGLVPLAYGAQALETASAETVNIGMTAAGIVNVSEFAEAIKKHQVRQVDIAIQHADPPLAPAAVDTSAPLTPEGSYKIRVHIGHRGADSVMVGSVPPVDPLLPETEQDGYHLEVALFEKDFKALSPTLQELYLPRLDRSKPIFFDIRAPKRTGVAEAKINIYHENNLLQSFELKAHVSSDPNAELEPIKLKVYVAQGESEEDQLTGKWIEIDSDKRVLTALSFTQTSRLSNLEQLHRRELSIGFNEDLNPANHTFMMKVDGVLKGLTVKDAILEQQTDGFRDLLKANVHDGNKKSIFPTYPAPGDESREVFRKMLQQLMEKGSELYKFLFTNVPKEMKEQLKKLKSTSDKTIQVVRFDIRNVFPWPIVYDFNLPTLIEGAGLPDICLGMDKPATKDGPTYPVKKCSHGPNDEVYCIYGFWGLRHQIEQLFKLPSEETDTITELVPGSKSSFIRLAEGTGDPSATKLSTALQTKLGAGFVKSTAADDLMDVLWDDTKRPAVLVVMGHLQQSPIAMEPKEERIVLVPKQKWFLASSIFKRLSNATTWTQPNTLVMLMACSSGATELVTLSNFVTNLNSAGAAAVVGTECLVFSSLVGRFAEEVTLDLWGEKRLGEAMKFFNRRLVSAGNPLAFVFNCLGNADLKLVKPH